MADEETEETAEEGKEEVQKSGGSKKLYLIGGVVTLLLAGGGVGAYFLLAGPSARPVDSLSPDASISVGEVLIEGEGEEGEYEEDEEPLGAIFPLETFVVNLVGGKFIRCQVQLEFHGRNVPQKFYAKRVPIRDGIIDLITQRSSEDLSSKQGKDELRDGVVELVNEMLRKQVVKRTYFTQFVIQ